MTDLYRSIVITFLAVTLAACSVFQTHPTMTALPLTTLTAPGTTSTPFPRPSKQIIPPTQTPSMPASLTPVMFAIQNGLTWTECVVPDRDYAMVKPDIKLLTMCADMPEWGPNDSKITGEQWVGKAGWTDLRMTIGSDHFEGKFIGNDKNGLHYTLTRNGTVLYEATAYFLTFDPNQNLWNIDGKLVWELAGSQPVIIVDGINFNEKYQLEGSYFPYAINGKLIYVAKKNGKYSIVYDEKFIGPEFDEISMPYCCGMVHLLRGNGQYWFVGSREGTKYLVSIQGQ